MKYLGISPKLQIPANAKHLQIKPVYLQKNLHLQEFSILVGHPKYFLI